MTADRARFGAVLAGVVAVQMACGDEKPAAQETVLLEEAEAPLPPPELDTRLPPSVREAVLKPYISEPPRRSGT